jgi:hypothetical protein
MGVQYTMMFRYFILELNTINVLSLALQIQHSFP